MPAERRIPIVFVTVALLIVFLPTAARATTTTTTTTYLSDLSWTSATNGWGPVEKNKSNGGLAAGDGRTITLNGTTYTKGLGTHAVSDIRYALSGACSRFRADVGVDDEITSTSASVVFQVFADGTKLYDSGLMGATTATKSIDVNLTGKNQLQLVVTDAGNGNNSDHADWAAARIDCGSGSTPPPPSGSTYPSSFYSGPAGTRVLLPPNGSYPSTGAWIGEVSPNGLTQVYSREQYIGRKFNIYSYYAQNRCDPWPTTLASVASGGYIPMISWFPTPAYADQIINGQADSCIRAFGNAIASQSARVLLRLYWEFNGGWQPFSKNSNGTRATAAQEKQVWQHTIDVLRTTNAFSKASVVWSVSEGYYNNGDAWNNPTPYPGDNYVDWVASGGYNHNSSSAWCGLHANWCTFAEALTHGYYAPKYTPRGVEYTFRGRKPYLVGETGSVEDPNTAGRKGQWMVDMGNYAKTYMPGLYAIVYFDQLYNGINWSLNTSTSSLNGFKSFANVPYFKIPNS
jgi:hypothetical protein